MRKSSVPIPLLLAMMCLTAVLAAPAWSGDEDLSAAPSCPICGMDRHQFAHSRMLIRYTDGSQFGACSLHCAALELAYDPGKVPSSIEVGDYDTRQLINAETAIWVLGGSKMGVMTGNAKWAFGDKKAAQQFVDQHGGRIVDFETAISAAYADMYQDTRMIREKRKHMKSMSGQKPHGTQGHGQHTHD